MAKGFHNKVFDDATQVKLAIFQGYIREWLPVFLTNRKKGQNVETVNIFDFFAGPGADSEGNPGSPRIVQDELKSYCKTHAELKAKGIQVSLFFNDKVARNIAQLKERLAENACPKGCCKTHFTSALFREAFADALEIMRRPRNANLLIMDQFGVKEVTPDVVDTLSKCPRTDILFFISSSYIRRFAREPVFQACLDVSAEELASSDYRSIHRYICKYFRSKLPGNADYYLAPFSIKKGSNIYGVVFGSGKLTGLERFLKVCWNLDGVTGEANYDIDEDPVRYGQRSFFPEDNVPKKRLAFQRELDDFLAGSIPSVPIDNLAVYQFTLERGFLPSHTRDYLKGLQKAGRLQVDAVGQKKPPRAGDFYLAWEYYQNKTRKVVFFSKD